MNSIQATESQCQWSLSFCRVAASVLVVGAVLPVNLQQCQYFLLVISNLKSGPEVCERLSGFAFLLIFLK